MCTVFTTNIIFHLSFSKWFCMIFFAVSFSTIQFQILVLVTQFVPMCVNKLHSSCNRWIQTFSKYQQASFNALHGSLVSAVTPSCLNLFLGGVCKSTMKWKNFPSLPALHCNNLWCKIIASVTYSSSLPASSVFRFILAVIHFLCKL